MFCCSISLLEAATLASFLNSIQRRDGEQDSENNSGRPSSGVLLGEQLKRCVVVAIEATKTLPKGATSAADNSGTRLLFPAASGV